MGALQQLLSSIGSSGPPFVPTDIAGLKVWYKADALVLSDGAGVSTWPDSSGSGNPSPGPSAAHTNPTYKTNIVNGKPVVRFDGLANNLTIALNAGSGAIANPDTIFFVHGNASGRLLDSANRQLIDIGPSTGVVTIYGGGGSTGTPGTIDTRTGFHVSCAIFNGGGSGIWVDGVADGTWGPGSSTLTDVYIASNDGGGELVNGDIAEVLIYNSALSTGDRQSVQTYLGSKYGITIT